MYTYLGAGHPTLLASLCFAFAKLLQYLINISRLMNNDSWKTNQLAAQDFFGFYPNLSYSALDDYLPHVLYSFDSVEVINIHITYKNP